MAQGPCWEGYVQVGMKMKNGKEVPNCVPTKKAKRTASIEEQNQKIFDAAFALVIEANASFSGTRRVTNHAARTVVGRSLKNNADQPYSVRRHRALSDLSEFITLAQQNRSSSLTIKNTDLLPVAHPRCSRNHNLTVAQILRHRSRWITDDPQIKDETVKTLIASAMTSHPATSEYEYAIARLTTMPQGMVPKYALLAALGDGNSSAARRARAMLQRRDRKGRFAEMGGGLRALVRRLNGAVQSLVGRPVSEGINDDTLVMELPDGRLVRVQAQSAEAIKAILPSMQTKDGYSKKAAKYSTGDPIINEADLEVVDAPDGFELDADWQPDQGDVEVYGQRTDLGTRYTDDAYDVVKFQSPNAPAKDKFEVEMQKEAEGQDVVTLGKGKDGWLDPNLPVYFVSRRDGKGKVFAAVQSWADVQKFIAQDEPRYENNELPLPTKDTPKKTPKGKKPKATLPSKGAKPSKPADGEEAPSADFDYPEGYYKIKKGAEYAPEGPIDGQVSPDFTDDPVEIAQRYETEQIVDALEQGVSGTKKDPATGFGVLPFEAGDELVPAEALYNALKEKGEDADAILGDIYRKGKGAPEAEAEVTPKVSDEVKEALGKDVEKAPLPEGEGDVTKLPPLLEGLTDEEKEQYAKDGNYKKFLPKNKTNSAPEGYAELDEEPFDAENFAIPEDAPEGFNFNPVDIANGYTTEQLERELRRSLEPSEMPGYGVLAQETPEGEQYVGYVPGEAIRDALQLRGVNTNELIDRIYAEGEAGQGEPEAKEIADALEGENVQEEAPAKAPQEEARTPREEQAPSKQEGVEAPDAEAGEPAGRELTPEEQQEGALEVGEPQRINVRAADIQPGDIAVRDGEYFVIEEVEAPKEGLDTKERNNKKLNRIAVKGYYPGHQTQERDWWAEGTIEVIRGAAVPEKGDGAPLDKPKLEDYVADKKEMRKIDGEWGAKDPAIQEKYLADLAAHKAAVQAASAKFNDPTKGDNEDGFVANAANADPMPAAAGGGGGPGGPGGGGLDGGDRPPFIVKLPAAELQAGDITTQDHFKIVDVRVGENGKLIITGHYPGYGLQDKQWKPNTKIEVIRGIPDADGPQLGEGSLHRPAGKGPKGGWFPDDNTAANEEHQAKVAEAKNRWEAPKDLPVVAASDLRGDNKLEENDKPPKAPFLPGFPPFQGQFAEWARQAGGDWQALAELLQDKEFLVFDFETTGVDVLDGNEPWQIAAVKVRNGQIVDRINIFMKPNRSIKGTYAGNNAKDPDGNPLTDEFFADKPSQEEALKQFLEWAGENPLVIGQNVRFDDEVMRRKAAELGLNWNPNGVADTMGMAAEFQKDDPDAPKSKKLAELAKWLGVEQLNWHAADDDARVTAEIFQKMIERGIANGYGKSALDVDARQAEFDQKMADKQPDIDKYNEEAAAFLARKALRDALAGAEVNLDDIQKQKPQPIVEGPYDLAGADGNPDPAPRPQADLIDVSINTAFPDGKMRIAEEGWADNLDNVEQLFRGDIKAADLRPGDFVRPKKDNDEFFQIVSIRGGEEFGVEEYKRRVVLQNAAGDRKVVFWNQNAFLDEVRRPKNRADLAAENAPEEVIRPIEELEMQAVEVAFGKGLLSVTAEDSQFVVKGKLLDDNGDVLYEFEGKYLSQEGAEAEGKALLRRAAVEQAEMARRREDKPEPKDPSVAIGQEPADVDNLPIVELVDGLPVGEGQNEIVKEVRDGDVIYKSKAQVVEDGEVIAEVVEEFPSRKAASAGGRDNIDAAAQALADQIAEQRDGLLLMSPGRDRKNLPPIPEKYRRQVYIRLLAGLYADADGNPLAIGDRVIHMNPEKAEKYGEGVVVGKVQGEIGGLQRKGVVYVDYVLVKYPGMAEPKKFVSRFQRHLDPVVAKERFDAEPRINWMNEEEMKIALEERRKKPRKGGAEAVDAADAEVKEVVDDVKNVADGVVEAPAEDGGEVEKPAFEHNIDWFKANVQPQPLEAGLVKVGDFLPTKGDRNIGRVINVEDLDRAVRIEVEYPDGRRWTYNPMAKGFTLGNVYRLGEGEAPAPKAEAPEAEAPKVEAPEAPAAGDPFVDVNDPAAIAKRLDELAQLLPKFRNTRAEKEARWTRRYIDELVEKIKGGRPLDKLDGSSLRNALVRAAWIKDQKLQEKVLPELQKLADNLARRKEAIREERRVALREKYAKPLPENLIPTAPEEITKDKAAQVFKEVLDRLPVYDDRDIDQEGNYARRYIENVDGNLAGLEDNDFDRIDVGYVESAADYLIKGELGENQVALGQELKKFASVLRDKQKIDRDERQRKFLEKLAEPIDADVWPTVDNIDRDKVMKAIDEVINRLPSDADPEADYDLRYARKRLERYNSLLRNGDDIDQVDLSRIETAIESLRKADNPVQNGIADNLQSIVNTINAKREEIRQQRIAKYKEALNAPFEDGVIPQNAGDVNKDRLVRLFSELANRLPKQNETDVNGEVRRAQEYAKMGLDAANAIDSDNQDAALRKFDEKYLDKIIDKLNRYGDDDEKAFASKVEEARKALVEKKNELRGEARQKFLARRDAEVPEDILPEDLREDKQDFIRAVDEFLNRLPVDDTEEADPRILEAANNLKKYRDDLVGTADPLNANRKNLEKAISGLRQSDEQSYNEIASYLQGIDDFVNRRLIERPIRPFAGINLEEVDPIEMAEQRVANRENVYAAPDVIKNIFADDKVYEDSPFLKPFKDSIQGFFDGNERPLAEMDIRTRQAVMQKIAQVLKSQPANKNPEDFERSKEMVNLIGKLHEERDAYQPQRTGVGEAGLRLMKYDPDEFMREAKKNSGKNVEIVINGERTGFTAKQVSTGINASYNYFVTDIATGQKFIFKRERGKKEAFAEYEVARIAAALGIAGRVHTEQHPLNKQFLIQTFAGDTVRLNGGPTEFANKRGDVGDPDVAADRVNIRDMIGMALLDAVINNTDRHGNNFLVADADLAGVGDNGHENMYIFPIDHGFAAALNSGATGGLTNPFSFITKGSGRTGGEINQALARKIGATAYQELVNMTLQQALQFLQRADGPGKELSPDTMKIVVDRINALRAVTPDQWEKWIGKK